MARDGEGRREHRRMVQQVDRRRNSSPSATLPACAAILHMAKCNTRGECPRRGAIPSTVPPLHRNDTLSGGVQVVWQRITPAQCPIGARVRWARSSLAPLWAPLLRVLQMTIGPLKLTKSLVGCHIRHCGCRWCSPRPLDSQSVANAATQASKLKAGASRVGARVRWARTSLAARWAPRRSVLQTMSCIPRRFAASDTYLQPRRRG